MVNMTTYISLCRVESTYRSWLQEQRALWRLESACRPAPEEQRALWRPENTCRPAPEVQQLQRVQEGQHLCPVLLRVPHEVAHVRRPVEAALVHLDALVRPIVEHEGVHLTARDGVYVGVHEEGGCLQEGLVHEDARSLEVNSRVVVLGV